MPRRKPISGKQKKEQQQIKRAIKRGDLPPPEPTKKPSRKRRPIKSGPTGKTIGPGSSETVIAKAKKLQSTFIKLPPKFLEDTKTIASTVPLPRPIPYESTLYHDFSVDGQDVEEGILSCPKRPKWRFDMSKKEVEHNEEGLFKKWLTQTDRSIEQWQKRGDSALPNSDETGERPLRPPPSPTYFERNLEVWRQLWRVTEISQIILVLLDSRCPLLHFPPSLADFLVNRRIILVLTKVDITGPAHVSQWIAYFKANYPDLRIVQVESYIERETTTVHQGKKEFDPRLADTCRRQLVEAIREAHADMLKPPDGVARNPDLLKKWNPPVKRQINWATILNEGGDHTGVVVEDNEMQESKPEPEAAEDDSHFNEEPEMLTIGMIGQPNVGKSSLLNALFGARRVRASKTPGKTKHFQTLYWTNDVRLVDCPGLVMPNYVPMEMQVLSGILPISKVSAIPACIDYVAKCIPLERVYKLIHPVTTEPIVEDKRTWREGMQPQKPKSVQWTTMDILTSYANTKGWVTAKAGRPDIHRAGNAILRALAEGRVPWAFWPPGTSLDVVAKETPDASVGAWLSEKGWGDAESDQESDDDEGEREGEGEGEGSEGYESSEVPSSTDESEGDTLTASSGRFRALQINDVENEYEDEDEEG